MPIVCCSKVSPLVGNFRSPRIFLPFLPFYDLLFFFPVTFSNEEVEEDSRQAAADIVALFWGRV